MIGLLLEGVSDVSDNDGHIDNEDIMSEIYKPIHTRANGIKIHTTIRVKTACPEQNLLEKVPVVGDGACCFTALIQALELPVNVEGLKDILRKSPYVNHFKPDIDEELNQVGVWDGMTTITLAAMHLNTNICVHLELAKDVCLMAYARDVEQRTVHIHYSTQPYHYDYYRIDHKPSAPPMELVLFNSKIDSEVQTSALEFTTDNNSNVDSTDDKVDIIPRIDIKYDCECMKLNDYNNFKSHDRNLLANTAQKIDQLIDKLNNDNHLMILGSASIEGDMSITMCTTKVKSKFKKISGVDIRHSKFAINPRITHRSFEHESVDFAKTHSFFSDMYMCEGRDINGKPWVNNGLKNIIEKYKRQNDEDVWDRFQLIHKLTWSVTNISDLVECLSHIKSYEFVRVNASGKSSEWFVVAKGLSKFYVDCCVTANKLHTLWSHADACANCQDGRLVAEPTPFHAFSAYHDVQTNCLLGCDTFEKYKDNFIETGHINNIHKSKIPKERSAESFSNAIGRNKISRLTEIGVEDSIATRHDEVMLITKPVESDIRMYVEEHTDFNDFIQTWVKDPKCGLREYHTTIIQPIETPKPIHPPSDSYLALGEMLPNVALDNEITSLNDLSSQIIQGKFNVGKVTMDEVIMPINARRHPVKMVDEYRAAGPGMGLFFSARKPCQTLAVLETRYLNAQQNFPFTNVEKDLARSMVDMFCNEHWRVNRPTMSKFEMIPDHIFDTIYEECLKDMKSKGYAEKF